MTEQELIESLNKTIIGLEEHFIEESCTGFYTFGCMSCQAIRTVQDLKEMMEVLSD